MPFGLLSPALAAAKAAATIAQYGNKVYLPDESDFTAIVDENPESIRRQVGDETIQNARGRPFLFWVTKEDAARVPEGEMLRYNDQQLTQGPRKSEIVGNVTVRIAIFASSGGVG